MLNGFDWLRRSRTGAELLATLKCLETQPDLLLNEQEIGPPHSALRGPCPRCWVYPRQSFPQHNVQYCRACQAIVNRSRHLGDVSRESAVVWGFVNRLPRQLSGQSFGAVPYGEDSSILGSFVQDNNRFLAMLLHRQIKPFLQELVMYHGEELKGLIQIVPTVGVSGDLSMADVLCRVIHYEANFSMDRLRVRFYAKPYQVLIPHVFDRKGVLTFDISDFLSALEMAAVFRTLLQPDEQEMLHDLLRVDDPAEAQFYWGRLMGLLSGQAKDMLSAWNIRQWPKDRIKLFYELMDYVAWYQ
jgi:uncharacterized protein GlcG (DUF336 family)